MVTESRVGVPVVRNEKKRKERKMRVRWPGDKGEKPRDCRGQGVETEKGSRKN